ncbi:MAG: hypothetical protein HFG80_11845 [Eubacterium sp.]|nr:hypothetical protein [Eubacterium sp.]
MKRLIILCACIVVSAGILAGCSGGLDADVSTVKVDKKGRITGLTVESFEKDYYSKEDLESFITEQVENYIAQNPDSKVEVKDISVEDQTAKVMVEYAGCEEYASFNEADFYAGTVVQARAAGYRFDADFYAADSAKAEEDEKETQTESETSDTGTENADAANAGTESGAAAKKTSDISSILNEDGYKAVVTNERVNIKVDGEILYVSDPTAVLVSSDTIELPADETKAEGMHKTSVYIIYK